MPEFLRLMFMEFIEKRPMSKRALLHWLQTNLDAREELIELLKGE